MLLRTLLCGEKYSAVFGRRYSQATVNLSEPTVQQYLKHLLLEHNDLHSKPKRSIQETNRMIEIQPIAGVLEERIMLFDSIESLKELNKKDNKDEEMKKMIKIEAEIYLRRIQEMDNDLLSVLLLPILTDGGILLEVTAGAGGQEAMLFAKELFETYHSYANYKSWVADVASFDKSDIGGIRKGSMLIEGYGVPELMRMEAGVHRVQRIPATEKSGRIHTSTVSVAVLPQAKDIELDLPDRDLVIETKRASGAGGQHVNTTDSAVRIIHSPSGIAVECQEGRSQIKNKEIAIQKLKALLLQKQQQEQTSMIQQERKSQVKICFFFIKI